jgi:glutamyl-tRNA synthetase
MIHGTDGKKLSKRHGATAVADYEQLGILPQAMLNFLALLGWSPGGDREVMTVPDMIELFDASGLSKKAAVFDTKKLEWMNGQHLSLLPLDQLEPRITPAIVAAGLATDDELRARREWYLRLLDLLRVRARTVDDVVRQAGPYFRDAIEYDADAVAKQWKDPNTPELLRETGEALAGLADWTPAAMEERLRGLAERRGIGGGKLFQPLRVALTGMGVSPGIFEVMEMLGRERTLRRIAVAVERTTAPAA